MAKQLRIPYVVQTGLKMVFFGYAEKEYNGGDTIRLYNARMCVYWSLDVRGIPGLAANGPTVGCCISPAAPSAFLNEVKNVFTASEEAVNNWEAAPWK